jgi:hypothetical protein
MWEAYPTARPKHLLTPLLPKGTPGTVGVFRLLRGSSCLMLNVVIIMSLTATTYTLTFNGAMTLDAEGHDDTPENLAAFIVANYDPTHLVANASFDAIAITTSETVPNPTPN